MTLRNRAGYHVFLCWCAVASIFGNSLAYLLFGGVIPRYFERHRVAQIVEEATPEWDTSIRIELERRRQWIDKDVRGRPWMCKVPRHANTTVMYDAVAMTYIEHYKDVVQYNRRVSKYQQVSMRNLHGYQYAGLGIPESLPQIMRTCRGEEV